MIFEIFILWHFSCDTLHLINLKVKKNSMNSITESQEFLNKKFKEIKTNVYEIQTFQTKENSKLL